MAAACVVLHKLNDWHTQAQFCCLVGGVVVPEKPLSSKEAVADPLPKICCLVGAVLLSNCCQVLGVVYNSNAVFLRGTYREN